MKLVCAVCGERLLVKHAKVTVGDVTSRRAYHIDCYTNVCRPLLTALLAQVKAIQEKLAAREAK